MFRLEGRTRTLVKSLLSKDPKWDEFILAFKEVCNNNSRYKTEGTKKWKNPRTKDQPYNNKENNFTESTRAQPSVGEKKLKTCYTCNSTDPTHDWKVCKAKKKPINEMNMDPDEDQDPETRNQDGDSTSDSDNDSEGNINMIETSNEEGAEAMEYIEYEESGDGSERKFSYQHN